MKKKTLKAAIPGYGATGHLATTLLAQEAKISLDQIPYRGAAPAMTDLLGGHVDLFFATPQSVVPQVAAGKLKAYGITSKESCRATSERRKLGDGARAEVRDHLLAGSVRAGRHARSR